MLNQLLQDALTIDRLEIKTVNRLSLEVMIKLLFKKKVMLECQNSKKGKHISCIEKINDECYRYIRQLSINKAIKLEEEPERKLINAKSNTIAEDLLGKYYLMRESVSNNFESTGYSLCRLEILHHELKQDFKEKEKKWLKIKGHIRKIKT